MIRKKIIDDYFFAKISYINNLFLNKVRITDSDIIRAQKNLKDVYNYTKENEDGIVSFFYKSAESKVAYLYPDNDFQKECKSSISDDISLLIDGESTFQKIIENIRNSKQEIYIKMFIWYGDETGWEVATELFKAAERGVKVIIIKDFVGKFFEIPMGLWHGHDDSIFQQIQGHENITFVETVLKDHSKLLIFDKKIMLLGGINIGDGYRKDTHDFMVEIRSRLMVQMYFDYVDNKFDVNLYLPVKLVLNVNCPDIQKFDFKPIVLDLLDNAKEKVFIEMVYWGDEEITQKIIERANHGIKFYLIFPKQDDSQDNLNKLNLREIKEKGGNNIYLYAYKTDIHSKVINIDGEITMIGSANFNVKSTKDMQEVNILVNQDKSCKFTKDVLDNLQIDMSPEKSDQIKNPEDLGYSSIMAFIEGSI